MYFLSARGRPKSLPLTGLQHSTRGEEFAASARMAFRTATTLGAIKTELDVNEENRKQFQEEQPEIYKGWEQQRRVVMALRPGFAFSAKVEFNAANENPLIASREDMQLKMADKGMNFSDDIPMPEKGMTLGSAIAYQKAYEAQKRDENILANSRAGLGRYVAQFGGAIAGSIPDPVNLIPFGSGFQKAKLLGQGTKVFSKRGLQGLGKSAATGFVENAAAAVAVDAVAFQQANRWGAGLGTEELIADATIGGLLGAALSTLGTAVGRRLPDTHTDKLTLQARHIINEIPVGKFNPIGDLDNFHWDSLVKANADANAGRDINVAPIWEGTPIYDSANAAMYIRDSELLAAQIAQLDNMSPKARAVVEPKLRERQEAMGNVDDFLYENRASLISKDSLPLLDEKLSKAEIVAVIKSQFHHTYFDELTADSTKVRDINMALAKKMVDSDITSRIEWTATQKPSEYVQAQSISLAEASPEAYKAFEETYRQGVASRSVERERLLQSPASERIAANAASIEAKTPELNDMIANNRLTPEAKAELDSAAAQVETVRKEAQARDEAINCIIQNGM